MNARHITTVFMGVVSIAVGQVLLPESKIIVNVNDEAGQPVSNATVNFTFDQGGNRWKGEIKKQDLQRRTDTNGICSATEKTVGLVGISAEKTEYYSTYKKINLDESKVALGHFVPWESKVELVLKSIKNPVPMYVKRVETHLQEPEKAIGYDLTVGDWIAPHGKGVVADMILEINRRVTNWKDYESKLKVTFSNPGDGLYRLGVLPTLEGSMLKSPHEAPETGYQNEIIWRKDRIPAKDESGRDEQIKEASEYGACIFRVRTVMDEQGNVIKAMYGKILPCLEFDPRESPGAFLRFTYYLNPSGTRDLEFNGENLFSADRQKYDP